VGGSVVREHGLLRRSQPGRTAWRVVIVRRPGLERVWSKGGTDAVAHLVLLLLLQRAVACAGGRTYTQRVLAIRQPDAASLDQPIESVPVQVIEGLGSIVDVFKLSNRKEKERHLAFIPERSKQKKTYLDEAHRTIRLLSKAQLAETRATREQLPETILEVIWGTTRRHRRSRQVADVQRVDLKIFMLATRV
jgi:hypothetical protein